MQDVIEKAKALAVKAWDKFNSLETRRKKIVVVFAAIILFGLIMEVIT